jgi:hypothetical protein
LSGFYLKSIFGFGIPATLLSIVLALSGGVILTPGQLSAQTPDSPVQPGQTKKQADEAARRERAREQIRAQERQRILGVIPEFNTSNVADATSLTAKEKFSLAFKTAVDPATFLVAAITAGFGQATDSYHDYGQGMQGFGKYMGASYADSFDGTMLGNALFPALLHEDPRYFRKGTGSFKSRFGYAVMTTVRTRDDSGKWVPNFGNIMGNLAAGGIANLYYPEDDRGAALTVQRAFVVTAEGAIGSLLYEFWPDFVRKVHKKKP